MEQDASQILQTLAEWSEEENDPIIGHYEVAGDELEAKTAIIPSRINDAVELLVDRGLAERVQAIGGMAPYNFVRVWPTNSGRLAIQQAFAETAAQTPSTAAYDVFLSHSGLDDDLAKDIQKLLVANQIRVFCTPDSIPSGIWEPQIENALENSTGIWVILTSNALKASVWVHQELGYFYGFHKEADPDGHRSHYVFEEGTPQPGLYYHLMGTRLENVGDPEGVARAIAESLGREIELPDGWEGKTYATSTGNSAEDDLLFRDELPEMTDSKLSESIRQSGHWEIIIRPASYLQGRIGYAHIYSTVQGGHVRHTDWDFPSMDSEPHAQSGAFWKGDEYPDDYREVWRMSQSGQFVGLIEFPPDLGDLVKLSSREEAPLNLEGLFSVHSAVIQVTGAFEFAANLCREQPDWPSIVIEIQANNIAGRTLATKRRLIRSGRTEAPRYVETFRPLREELINDPHGLAIQFLENLFQRFGWNHPRLPEIQSGLM